ncbi:MAG: hypothetical protein AAFS10_15815 [Myxococcota bacterium]
MIIEELSGIWLLKLHDIHRETDWFLKSANLLVESIHKLLLGHGVSIRREPRSLGFNTYSYPLAGDLAQCLRYARAEAEMTPNYIQETVDAFSTVFASRVIDLSDKTDLIPGHLPVPEFDWGTIADRPLTQILWAAQGRHLLEREQPIPSQMASALTGWSPQRLSRFQDGDTKMTTKRIDNVVHYNPQTIDLIVHDLEELFFSFENYTPL